MRRPCRLPRLGAAASAALSLVAAALAGGRTVSAQATAAKDAPVLIVTVGPRGGEWKRVFNPFREDNETRFPSRAGIYEPLIIYNRATGDLLRRLEASADPDEQTDLSRSPIPRPCSSR